MKQQRTAMSRRTLLRGSLATGIGTVGTSLAGTGTAHAAGGTGKRVAVFGGGIAGLTAAHELVERGFQVTVYERRALGGKARSIPVSGTGTGVRPDLPGEHGFRFFPGFYQHIPDTMRRIPFADNPNGVWDNLVAVPEARFARSDGDDFRIPLGIAHVGAIDPATFGETFGAAIATATHMPPAEGMFFANRLLVFNTSSDERRFGQWERTSWQDFVGDHQRSHEFRALLGRTLTSLLVAAKPEVASVRTIAGMGEQFLGNPLEIGFDGSLDRVLNGPTNDVWIDPWVQQLRESGVTFEVGTEVRGLQVDGGRIRTAHIVDSTGTPHHVDADYFVVALPAERATALWNADVLTLWPQLKRMQQLRTDWMNGIQYYLREPTSIGNGHTAFIDSPWSLTSITQNELWARKLPEFGDGAVADCLSVDISDWDSPGVLYRKPARECTAHEIAQEAWAQMSAHLDDRGEVLRPETLHSWFLDPAIVWQGSHNTNTDPLLINTAGSWDARPEPAGPVQNLFLAGDYVRTGIDLASMEGANESARAAVNALLDVDGSNAPRCSMYSLWRTPELDPLRRIDADRYAAGLPNLFDTQG